ncbi:rRNA methyltransferase [Corynebacterium sp. 13CS0277]|uniref:DUF7782 domain-containing protein n=1 Tax=Corynebacterium sp. 13CS0277 TaxID=2071994 RepID=UPI000D02383F|nr:methyltransferase [Corynebacterium sp. 13CS0277]PRQ10524.1 rRNA methyltransferase [Corynebacterium sp. 13CS0277]
MHDLLITHAPALVRILRTHGYDTAGLAEILGPAGLAAAARRDPVGVRWAARGDAVDQRVVRAFFAHEPQERDFVEQLLGAEMTADLVACGALRVEGTQLRVVIDIRPVILGGAEVVLFSDSDGSMARGEDVGAERVLGMGSASQSLLGMTPLTPARRVLDLGTGCAVQALAQAQVAEQVIATDVLGRAVDFARASVAGAQLSDVVEVREGSWFEPVAGMTFDRIVANPPFVVGMPDVGHVYRDSGMNLDGATQFVVENTPDYLAPGGTAYLLGAWVHTPGEQWQQRVSRWIPSHGVHALILQRDVADPSLYVDTWLRDEGCDLREEAAAAKATAWLEHFAAHDVTGIGFGYIALRKVADEEPSIVRYEDFSQPLGEDLGAEMEHFFARQAWLAAQDVESMLAASYQLHPQVALEDVAVADAEAGLGFAPAALRISRMDGPRYSHDITPEIRTLLAGLHPQGLSLGDVLELYGATQGLDEEDLAELRPQVASVARDLVDHGLLLPADLVDASQP